MSCSIYKDLFVSLFDTSSIKNKDEACFAIFATFFKAYGLSTTSLVLDVPSVSKKNLFTFSSQTSSQEAHIDTSKISVSGNTNTGIVFKDPKNISCDFILVLHQDSLLISAIPKTAESFHKIQAPLSLAIPTDQIFSPSFDFDKVSSLESCDFFSACYTSDAQLISLFKNISSSILDHIFHKIAPPKNESFANVSSHPRTGITDPLNIMSSGFNSEPRSSFPLEIGKSDLDPFSSFNPQGGSIVGPNHPIFQFHDNDSNDQYSGGFESIPRGSVPPGARFDPIGPFDPRPRGPPTDPRTGRFMPQNRFSGDPDRNMFMPPGGPGFF
ncbi:Silencing boundary-establishment protein FUB1-like protein [Smittium mucronatum]|uniref:Silencing boundary-establishment protein FUB1-like protein n=1 Tax=Smittium mucronatum TaxID=133383 RepID=A0A1R0GRI8_9FUNG|nr:Silencing boundary-establishment protein FUB1-like protein [Smittium mucronatum]